MRLKHYVRGFELTVPVNRWQRQAVRQSYRYLRGAGVDRVGVRREIVHLMEMFASDTRLREVKQ